MSFFATHLSILARGLVTLVSIGAALSLGLYVGKIFGLSLKYMELMKKTLFVAIIGTLLEAIGVTLGLYSLWTVKP